MDPTIRTSVLVTLAAVGAALAVGCSGIRVVRESKYGGEIALFGSREDAMVKARQEMAATCGGPQNYEVVEEGEVVVGTVSTTHEQQQTEHGRTFHGRPAVRTNTVQTTDTQDKTEWRVKYQCKGAEAPPPAPGTGAPPPDGTPQPAPTDAAPPPAGPQGRIIHELVIRF